MNDRRKKPPKAIASYRARDPRDDLVERYLPEPFWRRLPPGERWWRGRTVLLLWALGYPLEMAWSYGVNAAGDIADELQQQMAHLDDTRLIGDLEATAEARGDGGHLEFAILGT